MKPPNDLIPPWKFNGNVSKQITSLLDYQKQFQGMREADHLFLYTEGSSHNDAVECSFHCIRASKSYRLHSRCSTFTAEMYAILKALKYIESTTLRRVVLCSGSLSSLQAVSRPLSDYLTKSVQNLIHSRLSRRYDLVLSWVPGHMELAGRPGGKISYSYRRFCCTIVSVCHCHK